MFGRELRPPTKARPDKPVALTHKTIARAELLDRRQVGGWPPRTRLPATAGAGRGLRIDIVIGLVVTAVALVNLTLARSAGCPYLSERAPALP